jgi:hypothetical protein
VIKKINLTMHFQLGVWNNKRNRTSCNNNKQQKLSSPAHTTKTGERSRNTSFYITLAPSPAESDDSDDGSCSYDSVHARETGKSLTTYPLIKLANERVLNIEKVK